MSGKLIVFEGVDGAGKATQTHRLVQRLEQAGYPVRQLTFPRYKEDSSMLVRMYLRGDFGKNPGDVNPYAASTFYAVDRYASYKQDWGAYYEAGGLLVTDRYTTSNAVHQGAKLPAAERETFLDWLFSFEYGLMGLPKPDLVLYLDLPAELSAALRRQREESTGRSADIHEADEAYLRACCENARAVADDAGWTRIDCADCGRIRPVEEIHEMVWRHVSPLL